MTSLGTFSGSQRRELEYLSGALVQPSPSRALPPAAAVAEVGTADLVLRTRESFRAAAPEKIELRITLGGEIPDIRRLRVELADDGTPLGTIDVRYGCTFQPFGLSLEGAAAAAVAHRALRLRAESPTHPVPILLPSPALADAAPGLAPHWLEIERGAEPSWHNFEATLASLHTLQPFNWLAGCVMDGLRAAGHHRALSAHLEYFFPDGRLHYNGPQGEPRENEIFGIEALLPFAVLPPQHPGIALMAPFVAAKLGRDGLLLDRDADAEGRSRAHTEITIEGCYTLAYPLAVASLRDHRPAWVDLAWAQIAARCTHLVCDGVVAQRAPLHGRAAQADWARAYGWFLLGVARTAEILGRPPAPVATAFAAVSRHILAQQRADGLWSVYLGEPATGAETSGSAAIAAGLALGARLELLPEATAARSAAQRAVEAMRSHLAIDGMLGGVSQLNRGGEPLQREGFRVLAPFAMGLLASARAALRATS